MTILEHEAAAPPLNGPVRGATNTDVVAALTRLSGQLEDIETTVLAVLERVQDESRILRSRLAAIERRLGIAEAVRPLAAGTEVGRW